jgi:hypothetical protein
MRVPTQEELDIKSTLTIITDASAWGCAGIAIDNESGTCHTFKQAWDGDTTHLMEASSIAEPEGIWRAACRFTRPTDRRIMILTDHSSVIAPSQRGYAKSWYYNLLLLRLRSAFPATTFTIKHVAGTENPSDEASRGGDWTSTAVQHALKLAVAEERGECAPGGAEVREGEEPLYFAHNNKSKREDFMV